MRTTLDIDDELLTEAVSLSAAKSKKGAVEEALAEFVNARKREGLIARIGRGGIDMTLDDLWVMRGCDRARAETRELKRRDAK